LKSLKPYMNDNGHIKIDTKEVVQTGAPLIEQGFFELEPNTGIDLVYQEEEKAVAAEDQNYITEKTKNEIKMAWKADTFAGHKITKHAIQSFLEERATDSIVVKLDAMDSTQIGLNSYYPIYTEATVVYAVDGHLVSYRPLGWSTEIKTTKELAHLEKEISEHSDIG